MLIQQSLVNVDSKEQTTQATQTDVYIIMNWSFQETEIDAYIGKLMQESGPLYIFLSQLRAMRALFQNPEQYAAKLLNDSPEAIQLKNMKENHTGTTTDAAQYVYHNYTSFLLFVTYSTAQPAVVPAVDQPALATSAASSTGGTLVVPQTAPQQQLIPPTAQAPAAPLQESEPSPMTNQLMDIKLQLQGHRQRVIFCQQITSDI